MRGEANGTKMPDISTAQTEFEFFFFAPRASTAGHADAPSIAGGFCCMVFSMACVCWRDTKRWLISVLSEVGLPWYAAFRTE